MSRAIDKSACLKLNEGLGGCYERVAYTNVARAVMRKARCRSMLELNATYIAGIPGFNSIIFAQKGYQVTITVRPRDYEDTRKAWELVGLRDKVEIIELDTDLVTPFKDNQFDMVWNHLAFDQYKDPQPMVKEMARISKRVIMHMTLAPYNYGFFLHKFLHWIERKPYDHGYPNNSTIASMKKHHRMAGLTPIAWGGVDCPPWMDTVDQEVGGSMVYADSYGMKDRWVWCSANPECRESRLVKIIWSWERAMPEWFKVLMAHHLYVASVKS